MMKLADKLFELRKEKGWSQESWQNKSMSLLKAFPSGSGQAPARAGKL